MNNGSVFESNDGGLTVYQRQIGHFERKVVSKTNRKTNARDRDQWKNILNQTNDETLQELLDQVELYYVLKYS